MAPKHKDPNLGQDACQGQVVSSYREAGRSDPPHSRNDFPAYIREVLAALILRWFQRRKVSGSRSRELLWLMGVPDG